MMRINRMIQSSFFTEFTLLSEIWKDPDVSWNLYYLNSGRSWQNVTKHSVSVAGFRISACLQGTGNREQHRLQVTGYRGQQKQRAGNREQGIPQIARDRKIPVIE